MPIKKSNIRIPVTMPKSIYNELLKIAEFEDRSISNLILTIIKDYLKNKGIDLTDSDTK